MPNLQSVARLMRFLLHREDWTIGVVAQTAAEIVRSGITARVDWLDLPRPGTILADPAVLREADGALTLFAEVLDHRRNVGEIYAGPIAGGCDIARAVLAPLLSLPCHMSYPFPFLGENGEVWLTAETCEAGEARLWRRMNGAWQPAGLLFPGRPVVDPTIWHANGRWWLFCGFQDDRPNERLHLFHARHFQDGWTPHPANPVNRDIRSSRGAGPIFEAGGLLIRPAQDCSQTYGGAVTLNAIRCLEPDRFEEAPIRRLDPVPGRYPDGLHTICPAGSVTFIDGKRLTPDLQGLPFRTRARFPRVAAAWRW